MTQKRGGRKQDKADKEVCMLLRSHDRGYTFVMAAISRRTDRNSWLAISGKKDLSNEKIQKKASIDMLVCSLLQHLNVALGYISSQKQIIIFFLPYSTFKGSSRPTSLLEGTVFVGDLQPMKQSLDVAWSNGWLCFFSLISLLITLIRLCW